MSYSVKQPKVSAQLGTGIGQGLAQQVPKEIERARLSSGLKDLQKAASEGASTVDLLSKGFTTPGMTPEMLQQLLPHLRSASIKSQQNAAPQQQRQVQPAEDQHQGFRRLGDVQSLTNRANELFATNPILYPSEADAYKAAEAEYANQQNVISRVDKGFEDSLSKVLHKGGTETASDVLGDLQEDFKMKAQDEVLQGKMSEQEAIKKYRQQALDFAKDRQKMKNIGTRSWWSVKPKINKENINALRGQYEKLGPKGLENFRDDLITYHNLTDQFANYLAYPPDKNNEVRKELKALEPAKPKGFFTPPKPQKINPAHAAERLFSKMKGTDSPLAIALALKSRGFNPEQIMREFKRLDDESPKFNSRQLRDFTENPNAMRSLGDFYLFAISDYLDPQGEVK